MRAVRLARHLVLFRREKLLFKGWNLKVRFKKKKKVRFLYSLVQFSNVPDKRMFIQSQSLSIFFKHKCTSLPFMATFLKLKK